MFKSLVWLKFILVHRTGWYPAFVWFCFFPHLAVDRPFGLIALGGDEKWVGGGALVTKASVQWWSPETDVGKQLSHTLFLCRGVPLSPIGRFLAHPSFKSPGSFFISEV